MPDVSVASDKIEYLFKCLEKYNGSTGFLVLFFVMLIFVAVYADDRVKRIFVPLSVVMVLTVYNPLFPLLLTKITKIDSEYYRFFWITPVVVLVPYVFTKLILAIIDGKIKNKAPIIVLALLVIVMSSKSVTESGMRIAENKYKIPNELIEISKIIHADRDKEYPKAFLEFEYNMQMRQYDAKMLLTIDREDYLYAVSNEYTTEMIDSDEFPQYRLLAGLIRYQNVEPEKIVEGLKLTNTEYVVLTTGSTMIPALKEEGLTEVKKTKGHTILKLDSEEIENIELIDYSNVYKEGL